MLLDVIRAPFFDGWVIFRPGLRIEVESAEIDGGDTKVRVKVHPTRAVINVICAIIPLVVTLVTAYIHQRSLSQNRGRSLTLCKPYDTSRET